MNLETLISLGYWVSSIGFIAATVAMGVAVKRFGTSTLGSIFTYLLIGTGIFFVVTIFQGLGADFFGIADESMDVWWHLMFYMAFFFWLQSLRLLVNLGAGDASTSTVVKVGAEKMWAAIAVVVLVVIFTIPSSAEGIVSAYLGSNLAELGLHHFLSFMLAGFVGYLFLIAKKKMGQIGQAIATPMIIAMWAFAAQHFWELLFESWKVVNVTSEVGEGGEKIFLTIAAFGVIYAAWRLNSFAKQLA